MTFSVFAYFWIRATVGVRKTWPAPILGRVVWRKSRERNSTRIVCLHIVSGFKVPEERTWSDALVMIFIQLPNGNFSLRAQHCLILSFLLQIPQFCSPSQDTECSFPLVQSSRWSPLAFLLCSLPFLTYLMPSRFPPELPCATDMQSSVVEATGMSRLSALTIPMRSAPLVNVRSMPDVARHLIDVTALVGANQDQKGAPHL